MKKINLLKELVSFKAKENLLSNSNLGKKIHFLKVKSNLINFHLDFKLTGFLNTEKDKYVFVSYLKVMKVQFQKILLVVQILIFT